MDKKLSHLQQILECTCGLQLVCLPHSGEGIAILAKMNAGHVFDFILQGHESYWQHILELPVLGDTVYEFTAPGGLVCFCYSCDSHIFLFGPLLMQEEAREKSLQMITDGPFPAHIKNVSYQFISTVPVIATSRVYRIVEVCLQQLLGLTHPLKIIQVSSLYSLEHMLHSSLPHITPEISRMREIEVQYEYGAALIEAVKHGNVSLAFHIVGQYIPGIDSPVRNKNPLRNAQNYCIILNTQLRHAMEECGIHPYRVDKLSHEIGLQIEQLTEVSKLKEFFDYVIRQYCRMVQQHAYPHMNPLTNLTVEYIKEHLSENLTVKDTAKALTINANYLSAQFHEQMGISFIDFVNRERVHQAAALLGNTHLQIQQIAQIVGYNNTSYFAKQFGRFMGVSPREYRSQHNLHT